VNPWLEIPLADYEGHMALAAVAQSGYLAQVLERLAATLEPRSVAVLGCAGGNGLDRLPPAQVRRVVGVDLNPGYLTAAQGRLQGRFRQLELHRLDLAREGGDFAPVDLVFAGLLFEYVPFASVLPRIRRMLNPGGHLGVVLQLPSADIPEVTPSPYVSLGRLEGHMMLVPPRPFEARAGKLGFVTRSSRTIVLDSGKAFQEFVFQGR